MRRPYNDGLGPVLQVIAGKWKGQIIWELSGGSRRFGALRKALAGASEKVLTEQLKELDADQIVNRKAYEQVPPIVEYSLTDLGRSLNDVLTPLCDWGRLNLAVNEVETAAERLKHPS